MRTDKLLTLADFLETIPAEKFNLEHWGEYDHNECLTAGCACGWSTKLFDDFPYILAPHNGKYQIRINWNDMEDYFGLTKSQADHLFLISSYRDDERTALMVAYRIRKLVKESDSD